METIYLSLRAQVAIGTFFIKFLNWKLLNFLKFLFLSFQIEDFETSITSFLLSPFSSLLLLSFSKGQKVKYLPAIYKVIILFFSVNLPLVIIYIFFLFFKFFFNPTTWRTSRISSVWRSTKKVQATQNFIKDKITKRVDILWRIFERDKKAQFLSFLSPLPKNMFFSSCDFIFNFFCTYQPFQSFCLLWNFV